MESITQKISFDHAINEEDAHLKFKSIVKHIRNFREELYLDMSIDYKILSKKPHTRQDSSTNRKVINDLNFLLLMTEIAETTSNQNNSRCQQPEEIFFSFHKCITDAILLFNKTKLDSEYIERHIPSSFQRRQIGPFTRPALPTKKIELFQKYADQLINHILIFTSFKNKDEFMQKTNHLGPMVMEVTDRIDIYMDVK